MRRAWVCCSQEPRCFESRYLFSCILRKLLCPWYLRASISMAPSNSLISSKEGISHCCSQLRACLALSIVFHPTTAGLANRPTIFRRDKWSEMTLSGDSLFRASAQQLILHSLWSRLSLLLIESALTKISQCTTHYRSVTWPSQNATLSIPWPPSPRFGMWNSRFSNTTLHPEDPYSAAVLGQVL